MSGELIVRRFFGISVGPLPNIKNVEIEIMKKLPIIGYFGYWVWLTYLSVVTSFTGITFALRGKPDAAVVCLILSGICDMFDGTVARTAKRNDTQKAYGIQIDSLADVMSFGLLPAAIGYCLFDLAGNTSPIANVLTIGICAMYVLCGLIRLAYFNVTEEEMQARGEKRTYYVGLPITMASLILSVTYFIIGGLTCVSTIYSGLLVFLACCFVSQLHIPKVKLKYMVIASFVGLGMILVSLYFRGIIG